MDMEKTGTYLASLRRGRDMTQQQVADILGVSNKTVSKWESGAGLPDIAALPALAALYGVTADDILAGETRPRACADTPAEVEAYLERRGSLRFRIGYSLAVMALAVWVAFPYNNWSWLCLLASPLCLWLGWGVCRRRAALCRGGRADPGVLEAGRCLCGHGQYGGKRYDQPLCRPVRRGLALGDGALDRPGGGGSGLAGVGYAGISARKEKLNLPNLRDWWYTIHGSSYGPCIF